MRSEPVTVADDTFIKTGSGDDFVGAQGTFGDRLVVKTGSGDDLLTQFFWIAGGPVLVATGGGNDSVFLGGSFAQPAVVKLGNGDDTIHVGVSTFSAQAVFRGQNGTMDVFEDEGTNTFAVPPIINGFEILIL